MTEHRFTMDNPNDWGFPITDNVTGKVYSCDSNILMKDLCNVVNGIVDENEQLKQDKKRLIGYLHRYGKVDVEDIDEVVLNQEYLDEWGELYGGDVE